MSDLEFENWHRAIIGQSPLPQEAFVKAKAVDSVLGELENVEAEPEVVDVESSSDEKGEDKACERKLKGVAPPQPQPRPKRRPAERPRTDQKQLERCWLPRLKARAGGA